MIFSFKTDIATLESYLSEFLVLIDADKWNRRSKQLIRATSRSPFEAKIIRDYHWLEFSLFNYAFQKHGQRTIATSNDLLCALLFTQTVVEVHKNLNETGKKKLVGRLKACLNAETGFAPLYIEIAIARTLLDEGYDVEFTDLEDTAQFDLMFRKGDAIGEVECKSISCDAGRKIHRKNFYRFIEKVSALLENRAIKGQNEIVLITLKDRLDPSHSQQLMLHQAIKELLASPSPIFVKAIEDFFNIELLKCNNEELAAFDPQNPNMRADVQKIFGQNCHVSGAITETGMCMVVMRSMLEDDTSAALLDALKKAASQFSKTRPAFITVQYEDIELSDLLSRPLRRRVAIVSNACYLKPNSTHVAATCIYAYRGLAVSEKGVGYPSFSIINPHIQLPCSPLDFSTFLKTTPDDEYAKLLGQQPPTENISQVEI